MSKNTRTRILLTAVAALLLVVMAVGGTLAYLTDYTKNVENTFIPTHVDIDLNETHTGPFDMVPGVEYDKDPIVTVIKGSEACWVFVEVTTAGDVSALECSVDSAWTRLSGTEGQIAGVYFIEQADLTSATANVNYPVLTGSKVKISEALKNSTMPTGNVSISFTAYAIQKTGFEEAQDAWDEIGTDKESYGVGMITAGT